MRRSPPVSSVCKSPFLLSKYIPQEQQKNRIVQVSSLVGCSAAHALGLLQRNGWNVNSAVDCYFSEPDSNLQGNSALPLSDSSVLFEKKREREKSRRPCPTTLSSPCCRHESGVATPALRLRSLTKAGGGNIRQESRGTASVSVIAIDDSEAESPSSVSQEKQETTTASSTNRKPANSSPQHSCRHSKSSSFEEGEQRLLAAVEKGAGPEAVNNDDVRHPQLTSSSTSAEEQELRSSTRMQLEPSEDFTATISGEGSSSSSTRSNSTSSSTSEAFSKSRNTQLRLPVSTTTKRLCKGEALSAVKSSQTKKPAPRPDPWGSVGAAAETKETAVAAAPADIASTHSVPELADDATAAGKRLTSATARKDATERAVKELKRRYAWRAKDLQRKHATLSTANVSSSWNAFLGRVVLEATIVTAAFRRHAVDLPLSFVGDVRVPCQSSKPSLLMCNKKNNLFKLFRVDPQDPQLLCEAQSLFLHSQRHHHSQQYYQKQPQKPRPLQQAHALAASSQKYSGEKTKCWAKSACLPRSIKRELPSLLSLLEAINENSCSLRVMIGDREGGRVQRGLSTHLLLLLLMGLIKVRAKWLTPLSEPLRVGATVQLDVSIVLTSSIFHLEAVKGFLGLSITEKCCAALRSLCSAAGLRMRSRADFRVAEKFDENFHTNKQHKDIHCLYDEKIKKSCEDVSQPGEEVSRHSNEQCTITTENAEGNAEGGEVYSIKNVFHTSPERNLERAMTSSRKPDRGRSEEERRFLSAERDEESLSSESDEEDLAETHHQGMAFSDFVLGDSCHPRSSSWSITSASFETQKNLHRSAANDCCNASCASSASASSEGFLSNASDPTTKGALDKESTATTTCKTPPPPTSAPFRESVAAASSSSSSSSSSSFSMEVGLNQQHNALLQPSAAVFRTTLRPYQQAGLAWLLLRELDSFEGSESESTAWGGGCSGFFLKGKTTASSSSSSGLSQSSRDPDEELRFLHPSWSRIELPLRRGPCPRSAAVSGGGGAAAAVVAATDSHTKSAGVCPSATQSSHHKVLPHQQYLYVNWEAAAFSLSLPTSSKSLKGGILGDAMGLGKTVQILALLSTDLHPPRPLTTMTTPPPPQRPPPQLPPARSPPPLQFPAQVKTTDSKIASTAFLPLPSLSTTTAETPAATSTKAAVSLSSTAGVAAVDCFPALDDSATATAAPCTEEAADAKATDAKAAEKGSLPTDTPLQDGAFVSSAVRTDPAAPSALSTTASAATALSTPKAPPAEQKPSFFEGQTSAGDGAARAFFKAERAVSATGEVLQKAAETAGLAADVQQQTAKATTTASEAAMSSSSCSCGSSSCCICCNRNSSGDSCNRAADPRLLASMMKRDLKEGGEFYLGGTLIVVPMSLLSQWRDEIRLHLRPQTYTCYEYYGSSRSRDAAFIAAHTIVLTTYQTLAADFRLASCSSRALPKKKRLLLHADSASAGDFYGLETKYARTNGFGSSEEAADTANEERLLLATHSVVEHHKKKQYTLDAPQLQCFQEDQETSAMQESDEDVRPLHAICFYRVVLDEGHIIKSAPSSQSQACCAIHAERRWILTGTPLQNDVGDAFALVKFLNILPMGTLSWWANNVTQPMEKGYTSQAIATVRNLLLPLMLRRHANTIGLDGKPILPLPPLSLHCFKVCLTKQERELYMAFFSRSKKEFEHLVKSGLVMSHYSHVLLLLLRLRQLCCHPSLVTARAKSVFPLATKNPEEVKEALKSLLQRHHSNGSSADYVNLVVEEVLGGKRVKECPICFDISAEPVLLTTCAHSLCYTCTLDLLNRKRNFCPICRIPFSARDVKTLPLQVAAAVVAGAEGVPSEEAASMSYSAERDTRNTLISETNSCGSCESTTGSAEKQRQSGNAVNVAEKERISRDFEVYRHLGNDESKTALTEENPCEKDQTQFSQKFFFSTKMKVALALLLKDVRAGHSCVVFSQWTSMLDSLEEAFVVYEERLNKAEGLDSAALQKLWIAESKAAKAQQGSDRKHFKKEKGFHLPYMRLDGSMTSRQRQEVLAWFWHSKSNELGRHAFNALTTLETEKIPDMSTKGASHFRSTTAEIEFAKLPLGPQYDWTPGGFSAEDPFAGEFLEETENIDSTSTSSSTSGNIAVPSSLQQQRNAAESQQDMDSRVRMAQQGKKATLKGRILLCSLKAGNVGLNLTRATRCYLMDGWWNPEVENQAMKRIWRFGQDKPVHVIRFVCIRTVEERLEELKEFKGWMTRGVCERTIHREEIDVRGQPMLHVDEVYTEDRQRGKLSLEDLKRIFAGFENEELGKADIRDHQKYPGPGILQHSNASVSVPCSASVTVGPYLDNLLN